MKVTIAVLDKDGDSVVDRVLDVLNTLSGRLPCHFRLVSPKKSVFEKSPGILSRQGIISSTAIGYVSTKPTASSGYEFLQLDDTAVMFEGRVYSPIPKKAVLEQVAEEPLHCETLLQTLMQNADGDYSFLMLKRRLDCSGKRPRWSSTALLWRKQKHRRLCYKQKSPLATRHRKPRFFSAWKHRLRE